MAEKERRIKGLGVSGTKEWATNNVNVVLGCEHGCYYCFARSNAQRYRRIEAGLKDWLKMRVNRKNRSKETKLYEGTVMFPSTHDITPQVLQPCTEALMNLLGAGNGVLIVSKPHLHVIDVLTRVLAPWMDQILFRFTIGALDGEIVKAWEPYAPPPIERLACLQMARSRGFQTSVSMEPMLDVENIKRDVAILVRYVTQSIWLGKMNKVRQRVHIQKINHGVVVADGVPAEEVQRLERWQTDNRIKEVYRHFTKNPVMNNPIMELNRGRDPVIFAPTHHIPNPTDAIRWKDSIKKVVGIDPETEAGTDR